MRETPDRWEPQHARRELAEAVDELGLLWPALVDALERDRGVSSGERVTASGEVLTVPLNVDVLRALDRLQQLFGSPGSLPKAPEQFDRLMATNASDAAQDLVQGAGQALRMARRAVGLSIPDRPLGQYCPRHDEPLVELVAPGDQGRLRYRALDAHGRPIQPTVDWEHLDVVECPHRPCGGRWTPAQQMFLRRLLRQADARRVDAALRAGEDPPGLERAG